MPVYRILASRTELYLVEAVIRAATRDEAEEDFYSGLEGADSPLIWREDYDGSDTEVDTVEELPPDHDPEPSHTDRTLCLYCGRPARWTGIGASESPTGQTIPGPWMHVERPIMGEGLGL
jgi:hypothetical protein